LFQPLSSICGGELGQGEYFFAGKIRIVLDWASSWHPKHQLFPLPFGRWLPASDNHHRVPRSNRRGVVPYCEHGTDYLVPQKNTPLAQMLIQKEAEAHLGSSPFRSGFNFQPACGLTP